MVVFHGRECVYPLSQCLCVELLVCLCVNMCGCGWGDRETVTVTEMRVSWAPPVPPLFMYQDPLTASPVHPTIQLCLDRLLTLALVPRESLGVEMCNLGASQSSGHSLSWGPWLQSQDLQNDRLAQLLFGSL